MTKGDQLSQLLAKAPQDLLLPDANIKQEALRLLKSTLDPIANKYSVLDAVHLDGLDAEQVWTQAQMIVDGAVDKLFNRLSEQLGGAEEDDEQDDEDDEELEELESGEEIGEMNGEEYSDEEAEEFQEFQEFDDEDEEADEVDDDDEMEFDQAVAMDDFDPADFVDDEAEEDAEQGDFDEDEEEEEEDDEEEDGEEPNGSTADLIAKLNDGHFELENFQQQVLQLENEEEEDDDENIDYFADVGQDSSDEDVHYKDFFDPPKKKSNKKKVVKAIADDEPAAFDSQEELEEAMNVARKDLFDSEDEDEDMDDDTEKLSKFELQQREIERQIQEMEDENVGDKHWAVKGEVQAKQRPQDSLVNTEIEFDRNAKPAPVITQEVTESLEDMIRERIKKQQFDDLPRRLPASDIGHRKSRDLPEVQETKSQKSLAELYEEDQLREQNPDYFKQQDNAAMDAAHQEIVTLFNSLSRKLDALSSWHYTPKAPQASLTIVTDAPAISMEEAQPSTMATGSMLAPQEVYKPSAHDKSEIIGANNLPVSRSEMTSEDRHRARRRAKSQKARENARKEELQAAKDANTKNDGKPKKQSKNEMFETLKKGNVSIVDKRGEKRDMRGNVVREDRPTLASHIKL